MKINASQIIKVIEFWQNTLRGDKLYPRSIVEAIDLKTREIVDIIGPRRSGKSSVLKLLIKHLNLKDNSLYINFEDPYFIEHDHPSIIEEIISVYKEYFNPGLCYLFFDEIQVISQWERTIRKLRDSSQFKIFVTGSSSKLLSSEIASLLTGRHLSYQLLPLSFGEYLQFKGVGILNKKDIILKEKLLLKLFSEYLSKGGFPEVVLTDNLELPGQYFRDIIQKDIVMRYEVREKGILEKMAIYLISNATKTTSIESLKKTFNISYKLASTYLDYLKEVFLLFEIPQFSYSLKKQQKGFKKIYAVDCGLANAVSFRFSEDKGRMLEICVFLHLLQMGQELYYYKTGNNLEIDFLVKDFNERKIPIQVTWEFESKKTKGRELSSLISTMDELKLREGIILTYDDEDSISIDNKFINIKPVYKWLLEREGRND
ncbi:MAG: ATP-binding protein [bacterium]